MSEHKCGFIAIIGRPNVGKSTLLNTILGQKLSITSRKPQTTRQRILGIKTLPEAQLIFADTPGIHSKEVNNLNKYMNKVAKKAIKEVDVLLLLIEANKITAEDEQILNLIKNSKLPKILALTKIDLVSDKEKILPFIEQFKDYGFQEIVPIAASKQFNVAELMQAIVKYLPYDVALFSSDATTDRGENFIVAEFIREQLVRNLGQELPYATSVEIIFIKHLERLLHIEATIWVEKAGQKAIVIGSNGSMLKIIGTKARLAIAKYFSAPKVLLKLWVKEKTNWSSDVRALNSLGYRDE